MEGLASRFSMKFQLASAVAFLLCTTAFAFLVDGPGLGENSLPRHIPHISDLLRTPHAVIEINNDLEFSSMGFLGDGSAGNPYLLDSLEIEAAGHVAGIMIGNTTVHFLVSNCLVRNSSDSGILLFNVTHGRLTSNECLNNVWNGISVVNSHEGALAGNNCSGSHFGIHSVTSGNISIAGSHCVSNGDGIFIQDSDNLTVENNTCDSNLGDGLTDFGDGVRLLRSTSVALSNTSCNLNGGAALHLEYSDANSVAGSTIAGDVQLQFSRSNTLRGNTLASGTIALEDSESNLLVDNSGAIVLTRSSVNTIRNNTDGSITLQWSSENNTVENNNCSGHSISIWYSSSNNTIQNNTCSYSAHFGIIVGYSDYNTISNNTCTFNNGYRLGLSTYYPGCGIILDNADHNSVIGNNCSKSLLGTGLYAVGIYLDYDGFGCFFNTVAFNICDDGDGSGIVLFACDSNIIMNNTARRNAGTGISVTGLSNSINGNIVESNKGYGVLTDSSGSGNSFDHNVLRDDGFVPDSQYDHVDSTNTVNGRPVQHIRNTNGGTVPAGAGQVIIYASSSIVVQGQNLSSADIGLQVYDSTSCLFSDNDCSDEDYGILLDGASSCVVEGNTAANDTYGIYIKGLSNDNTLRQNGIFNNANYGVYASGSRNMITNNTFAWNNGAGTAYSASHVQAYDGGSNFWNSSDGVGNYWADWLSPDVNFDGVVDFAYILDGGARDYYPVTTPSQIVDPQIPEFDGLFPVVLLMLFVVCFVRARTRSRNR